MHYAETTTKRASAALGSDYLAGISKVWLVVVTGTKVYLDLNAEVPGGQPPSGNTIVSLFEASGIPTMPWPVTVGTGAHSATALLSYPGLRFSTYTLRSQASAFGAQPTSLVRRGLAGFGSCPAFTTEMTATINGRTFSPGEFVVIHVVARNVSKHACTFEGSGRLEEIGPCGSIPMEVISSSGQNVYPGIVAYACPEMTSIVLPPGGQITARGVWGLYAVRGLLAPGRYTIVVAQAFAFPVSVT